jgi:threonylcarbamoyladenosine tRNA methylthiotransferase MtaB
MCTDNPVFENLSLDSSFTHTRAFVKIQDGCSQFCSYCIIPYVRGPIRSRKLEDILDEVIRLSLNGYSEVVLTGIHLTDYGRDLRENIDLTDVIHNIAAIDGIKRIRLGSLEPTFLTDEVVNSISTAEKLCRHFHMSLQSGSASVLKRMNRAYTPEVYFKIIDKIRSFFSDVAISTDIITGFPGETDEEFRETCEFIKKVNFARIHVFPYSIRAGTAAALMDNQVPGLVKMKRSELLINIGNEMEDNFLRCHIGTTVSVLIEEPSDIKGYMEGYTDNYMRVAVPCGSENKGKIINVKVCEVVKKCCISCEI